MKHELEQSKMAQFRTAFLKGITGHALYQEHVRLKFECEMAQLISLIL